MKCVVNYNIIIPEMIELAYICLVRSLLDSGVDIKVIVFALDNNNILMS